MKKTTTTDPTEGAFACMSATWLQNGLTKREYFAAVAMQGICASNGWNQSMKMISERSVEMADNLIESLNNGGWQINEEPEIPGGTNEQ